MMPVTEERSSTSSTGSDRLSNNSIACINVKSKDTELVKMEPRGEVNVEGNKTMVDASQSVTSSFSENNGISQNGLEVPIYTRCDNGSCENDSNKQQNANVPQINISNNDYPTSTLAINEPNTGEPEPSKSTQVKPPTGASSNPKELEVCVNSPSPSGGNISKDNSGTNHALEPVVVIKPQTEPVKNDNEIQKDDANKEEIDDEYERQLNSDLYKGISAYIPQEYWTTSLKSLSFSTIEGLSFRLDPVDETCDAGLAKDFTGLCERLQLDPAFTKYLVKSHIRLKTEEVLSKWEVLKPGEGPRPTVGNLSKIVYYDLDRPDVVTDLQENIVQDAEKWEQTKREANTDKPDDEDHSWELTRHDVATGKKTFYTCCLCYADEDEGMATLITNFFQAVCKDTRFFRPQFDLKMGKYVYDTTAKVIEERCNGKVIFLLSDYFYANPICQFAVNFAHSRNPTAEQGNLIPFYLTNKYDSAPKVLKGIAGVRWARKQFRYHSWGQITDCLMAKPDEANGNQGELRELQERIKRELDSSSSESWLCDPPYDEDTPAPGPALPLNEPPENSVNSSAMFDPDAVDESHLVDSNNRPLSRAQRILFRVRRAFSSLGIGSRRNRSSRPSRPIRPEELNQAFMEDRDPPDLV